jgi:hypothetical protein
MWLRAHDTRFTQGRYVVEPEMWHGSSRFVLSVARPFRLAVPSNLAVTPFPHHPHRTVLADFPHTALGQDSMFSPTEKLPQAIHLDRKG